jgi:hypothetical protein
MCQLAHVQVISLAPPELSLVNSFGASSAEIHIGLVRCTLRTQELFLFFSIGVASDWCRGFLMNLGCVQEIQNQEVFRRLSFLTACPVLNCSPVIMQFAHLFG